jgi:hypothetical protein
MTGSLRNLSWTLLALGLRMPLCSVSYTLPFKRCDLIRHSVELHLILQQFAAFLHPCQQSDAGCSRLRNTVDQLFRETLHESCLSGCFGTKDSTLMPANNKVQLVGITPNP